VDTAPPLTVMLSASIQRSWNRAIKTRVFHS